MGSYREISEGFVEDMRRFLGGLDAGIAKAQEYARSCQEAAEAAAEVTLAADQMAEAVSAALSSAEPGPATSAA